MNVGVSNIHLQFIPLLQNAAQEVAMAVVRVENRVEKICATLYVSIYHSWLRLFKKMYLHSACVVGKKGSGAFPRCGLCAQRGTLVVEEARGGVRCKWDLCNACSPM